MYISELWEFTVKAHAPTVPARYFVLLVDYLESLGLTRRDILQKAGIDEARFYQPNAHISVTEADALLATGKSMSGHEDIGFDFGLRIQLSGHDILGYAILLCKRNLLCTFNLVV